MRAEELDEIRQDGAPERGMPEPKTGLPPLEERMPKRRTERAPQGMRTFTSYRQADQSGVSGTGVVLEGVEFSTGMTVVHWLQPWPGGSLNTFASLEQFLAIHVIPHPGNRTVITFDNGETRVFGN